MKHVHNQLGSMAKKADKPLETEKNVDFMWGVRIPMRDGVRLNATVYKPKRPDPTPVIFALTPYIGDRYNSRALYFAQNGYAFALVDCRGRGNSEGEFEPDGVNEGPDGHDLVEWFATQPWCDGSVAMWGGSYMGFIQWMTLKAFPPHLRTIVPICAGYSGMDVGSQYIFSPNLMQWFACVSGVTGNFNLFVEQSFWIEKFREMYLNHRPFKELDQVVGSSSKHFQTWLLHPIQDAFWDRMSISSSEFDRINIPILTITGHYDGAQPGAMYYYRRHMQSSSPARDKHYLIIGPWDHAGTATPSKEFGGLTFGEASFLDMNKLLREWYDWTLKKGPQPEFLRKHVAYYLTGAEEWKYSDTLESISNKTMRLYLNSTDGRANDVFLSGTMDSALSSAAQPDKWTYDPLDTRPAELEREEIKDYLTDQRYALNLFGNGLVYHSLPFDVDTEITGYLKLAVWIALDVPDTDFQVNVSEILSNGKHILLTQDRLRARYRESLRQEKLIAPREINRYEFNGFSFFSRRVARNSRLRLVISCPNSIHTQKNYNSGGVVAEESARDARVAHLTLYHDADHPSCLELPIVE
jgi:putative CocE/NonD family hydrolase